MSSAVAGEVAEEDQAIAASLPHARRRKHRWRLWITAAVALVALGVGAGACWVSAYQPLEWGGLGGAGRPFADGIKPDATLTNIYGTEYVINSPDEGDQVRMLTSVRNDGPLAVTLTQIDAAFVPYELVMTNVQARVEPVGTSRAVDQDHPLVIPPGSTVDLTLNAAVPTCPGSWFRNSGYASASAVTLHYTALGMRHTSQLDLRYALTLAEGVHCD